MRDPETKELLRELSARRALDVQPGDLEEEPQLRFEQLRPHLPVRRMFPRAVFPVLGAIAAAVALVVFLRAPVLETSGREKGLAPACEPHLRLALADGTALESRVVELGAALTVRAELNAPCALTLIRADLARKLVEVVAREDASAGLVTLAGDRPHAALQLGERGDQLLVLLASVQPIRSTPEELRALLAAIGEGQPCSIDGHPCRVDIVKLEVR